MKFSTQKAVAIAVAMAFASATLNVSAQGRRDAASELSALSALPIASVVMVGGAASAAVVALPVALSVSGAVLVVKTVELTARGTLCVLERASDGAQVSIELAASGVEKTALGVGKAVQVSVIGAGAVLSIAGEAIAFVPNEIGRALLHNERITQ
jgi:hypothetical protein